MAIIIPMAGLSQRFKNEGYTLPKYMLYAGSKSLFNISLEGFKHNFSEKFLFIFRNVFDTRQFLIEELKKIGIQSYELIEVSTFTNGQADTVKIGLEKSTTIADTDEIFIFNIDTLRIEFNKANFTEGCEGYLEVFEGEGNNWSFVEPIDNTSKIVKRTTEKDPISRLCSNGLYYFSSKLVYLDTFNSFYSIGHAKGEEYIAPMYNQLIANGKVVMFETIPLNLLRFFGTPIEYLNFIKESNDN